ncbi:hypothetical protein BATDEDRAFT_85831 [Batrachochytrium dendrobatidis JAM81]|uniref:Uncharacterized protein n=2 Tax=Batrachochytrium dendrobatidis TaxID=109871 RepID=F4NVA5_BATDJ|nr:uncharacterized protein BATDEDRAFT_85831 [Batrachochytrium dendrobatidis JAM81]EGF83259.1 hypothetical protein BATDEDRAFT_85831 [Batrachochytrium dendrobatidis JAM81]KAK5671470.1 hypothetical protein QVD99_002177 [Batrachochytrium dendrobatidis]OAJ36575.1 hypothetical protein BDEG_20738 [Batrachochytrium dendrobatidis JEL423]|eukprot:XP_006676036.1 hypothetical protein BATDEDRAFT_85831 [Batrachochytrium dendrobatidis JAM81]
MKIKSVVPFIIASAASVQSLVIPHRKTDDSTYVQLYSRQINFKTFGNFFKKLVVPKKGKPGVPNSGRRSILTKLGPRKKTPVLQRKPAMKKMNKLKNTTKSTGSTKNKSIKNNNASTSAKHSAPKRPSRRRFRSRSTTKKDDDADSD